MMAPLPVWCQEPVARLDIVREELKRPQVRAARRSAPRCSPTCPGSRRPTIMDQASRLMSRQRFFNLVVTNVPGAAVPALPARAAACSTRSRWSRWPRARALGVALLSYDGTINFGLVGRLRPARGTSTSSRTTCASRSPSWPTSAGVELTQRRSPSEA